MKIFEYISSLLPKVEKDTILFDIRATKEELVNIVKPTYDNASTYFRDHKFVSDEVKALDTKFYQNFNRGKFGSQANFISEIASRIDNLIDSVTSIETSVEKNLERLTIKEGISAKRALVMRSSEEVSFLSRYAIDLLNYVYRAEGAAIAKKNKEEFDDTPVSPGEKKHIDNHFVVFAKNLSAFSNDPKKVKEAFDRMPDVVISDQTEDTILSFVSAKDLDPIGTQAMSGFTYNPIYHFRMVIAEWQTNRYNASREKKRELELRLIHLEMLADKVNDPKIEREISYIRQRVSKIERKMREEEESVQYEAR